jgi:hypothetical protein
MTESKQRGRWEGGATHEQQAQADDGNYTMYRTVGALLPVYRGLIFILRGCPDYYIIALLLLL